MPKLRLKKGVKKALIIILIVCFVFFIVLFGLIKNTKQKKLEETIEYKLTAKGYTEDDVKIITKNYKDKEIDYILKNEKDSFYLNIIKEKYFIYDKFYEYIDCFKEDNTQPFTDLVEKVNTNTDKPFYTDTKKADISKKELMLVNKYYYLETSYEPDNIVVVPLSYAYGNLGSIKLTEDTYNAFLNLWNAAHEAGYYLIINSAYRTFEDQQRIYDNYKNKEDSDYADQNAYRPGYSEHQTGYSLDLITEGYTSNTFEESDAYKWLLDNAYKYGFIQRYTKEKENITGNNFEAYHFRYVGLEASKYIYENNITFEEYYAYFVQ